MFFFLFHIVFVSNVILRSLNSGIASVCGSFAGNRDCSDVGHIHVTSASNAFQFFPIAVVNAIGKLDNFVEWAVSVAGCREIKWADETVFAQCNVCLAPVRS